MDIMSVFYTVIDAGLSFSELISVVSAFVLGVFADPNIVAIKDLIYTTLDPIMLYVPFVFLAIYIIMAIFGKKLFSLIRFIIFFGAGFLLGIHLLAPIILPVFEILPPWLIGVVVGVVAAVLSKFLYYIVFAVAVGYPMYVLSFRTILEGVMTVEGGKHWVALLIAAVVVVVAFLLRKYIEMLGTSLLAGWGLAETVRVWWDFTDLEMFGGIEWIGVVAVSALVGIIGFIIQFKTRERY